MIKDHKIKIFAFLLASASLGSGVIAMEELSSEKNNISKKGDIDFSIFKIPENLPLHKRNVKDPKNLVSRALEAMAGDDIYGEDSKPNLKKARDLLEQAKNQGIYDAGRYMASLLKQEGATFLDRGVLENLQWSAERGDVESVRNLAVSLKALGQEDLAKRYLSFAYEMETAISSLRRYDNLDAGQKEAEDETP